MKETLDEQSREALLVANGLNTQSHAGVKTLLGLHFVSKGLLSNEYGKTFSRLFEIRHSGDYDDFVYCDKEMIDEYTPCFITEFLYRDRRFNS